MGFIVYRGYRAYRVYGAYRAYRGLQGLGYLGYARKQTLEEKHSNNGFQTNRDAPSDFVVGPVMLPSASQVRPSAARASASGAMSRPGKKEQWTSCVEYLTGGYQ